VRSPLAAALWAVAATWPHQDRTRGRSTCVTPTAQSVEISNERTVNVIETERLLLEPLDMSRLEEFVALTAERDTMRYWAPDGSFRRDVAERNFAASLARLREHNFGRRWIVHKETGAGLGFTETKYFGEGYVDVAPNEVEIGWMLMPPVWGRGYATEAGAAVRDEAFVRLELESIVAEHHPANSASRRVMKKLGMEFERDVVARNGWPARLYRLTREQWASRR
jgi:[ribosomal protein S5]-alanine N-acetyltransferase